MCAHHRMSIRTCTNGLRTMRLWAWVRFLATLQVSIALIIATGGCSFNL